MGKELAITKDHDKNDEVIPMDVDKVKGKDKGKGKGKDNGGKSKGKQKNMPMWTTRARASNRRERMAKAKMPKERAKVYLHTPLWRQGPLEQGVPYEDAETSQ